ncbi:MAG: SDR family NAD(P)-dependent oxidoreductase [Acidimicrobiales bacterium]|nr:SDR family NAD(P)-dependent oxidoreductase [Acidimicrobiales bacterium]
MEELTGKVAVITGGASGMGRAFADRFAAAGMSVVLGDIEEPVLAEAVAELEATGAEVLGMRCDVSDHESVLTLRDATFDRFGAAHVVCLNAGVAGGGTILEQTVNSWNWVLGVNLFGIVHGLDAFLPGLVEQDEGHVLMTASIAGHLSIAGLAPYNASKHATVTIAESLYAELQEAGSRVGVSCLCPGFVATNIFTSERNRPEALLDAPVEPVDPERELARQALVEWMAANALGADTVADLVHDAVISDTFWIFTDDQHLEAVAERHGAIRERRNPVTGRLTEGLFD